MQIIPNFAIKDSKDQTVLALTLWNGYHEVATQLLTGGANINDYNSEGHTLLHQAILKQDTASAIFLLDRQADPNARLVPESFQCPHCTGKTGEMATTKITVWESTGNLVPTHLYAQVRKYTDSKDIGYCDIHCKKKSQLFLPI